MGDSMLGVEVPFPALSLTLAIKAFYTLLCFEGANVFEAFTGGGHEALSIKHKEMNQNMFS